MKITPVLLFFSCMLILFSACSNDTGSNQPQMQIPMRTIESAVMAQLKAGLITTGEDELNQDSDILPPYHSLFMSDLNNGDMQALSNEDLFPLDDAFIITHADEKNADMIAVLRAKEGMESKAENLASILHKYQISKADEYLPDQVNKIEKNVIKRLDRYILYITCSDPKNVESAISRTIK